MTNKLVALKDMPDPHVHYECIVAWAQGHAIEWLKNEKWIIIERPSWQQNSVYRIKPKIQTITRQMRITFDDGTNIKCSVEFTEQAGKLTEVKLV